MASPKVLRAAFRLGVGAVVVSFLVCRPGLATVLPDYGLLNGPTIPANGALLFDDEVESVTVTSAGASVDGTLTRRSGYAIWRSEQPLALGEYVVTPSVAADTFGAARSDTLTVVPAATLTADQVSIEIGLEVRLAEETATSCCRLDPTLVGAEPCDPSSTASCAPEPYCPGVRYRDAQYVSGTVLVDEALPISSQVLARFTALPGASPISAEFLAQPSFGYADFEATQPEYCVSAEIWDLTQDALLPMTTCEPNPTPVLSEHDVEPTYFHDIAHCHLPPEGFTTNWCEAMYGECASSPALYCGESYEQRLKLCSHYYELCGSSPPPPLTGTPECSEASPAPEQSDPASPAQQSDVQGSARESGCQLAAPNVVHWPLALWAVVWAALRTRRSDQRGARRRTRY